MSAEFSWNVRVYYEDTDTGGIVYYANYLKFYERARTEWLRALGVGQQMMKDELNAIFVVKSISVEYHAAARLDDVLQLKLRIEKLGRASLVCAQEIWCGEQLLNTAQVKIGCVDLALRPCALPAPVVAKMRGPQASQE
ncbi:MAG: tol-pal system-associated acyl-CoA thioesterase [Burkholderiales bacterium]|nr:tol-pal system-associated acyl-CoA thioesterase [Burkholderiales bacterium]